MVRQIPVTEARAQFSELINRVGYGGEQIVITRHGKPLVALVPASASPASGHSSAQDTATVLDLSSRPGQSRDEPTQVAACHHNRPET